MPVCKGCGGSYDDSFKFCPYCGRAKPQRETIKVKVEVTSEDVWETCEICLVYVFAEAQYSLARALGGNVERWVFEATAIGPQGRYAAAHSELLEVGAWGSTKKGDYHRHDNSPTPTLHRDNAQIKVDGLIRKLTADGWQPISRGEHWYSERFRRLVKNR